MTRSTGDTTNPRTAPDPARAETEQLPPTGPVEPETPAKVATFAALRIPNYRLFFSGQVVSNTGTWMQRIAQDWLVLELTGSAFAVGMTIALQFFPVAVLGLYGGLVADRNSKRLILLLAQTAMGVLAALLAVLTLTGAVQAWHVYLIAAALGVAAAFENPARQTFVNEMVPQSLIRNAVSLNVGNFQLARMVGPAVAGVLITAVGIGWAFAVNAVSYLAVIASLLIMKGASLIPQPMVPRAKGQLRAALQVVRSTPMLLWPIVLIFFIGTFGYNFAVILAAYSKDVFQADADLYGLLNTAMALGSVGGALLAARRTTGTLAALLVLAGAFGAALLVLGLVSWLPIFLALLVVVGFLSVSYNTMSNASVQLASSPEMRGRVMSLYMLVFLGTSPIGALLVGWITEVWGAPVALVVSGAACLLAVIGCAIMVAHRAGMSLRTMVGDRTRSVVVRHRTAH